MKVWRWETCRKMQREEGDTKQETGHVDIPSEKKMNGEEESRGRDGG